MALQCNFTVVKSNTKREGHRQVSLSFLFFFGLNKHKPLEKANFLYFSNCLGEANTTTEYSVHHSPLEIILSANTRHFCIDLDRIAIIMTIKVSSI